MNSRDTNRAQYTLMRLLGEKTSNVCVVGDDDQSIYSWRGADIRNIRSFQKDFKEARIIRLRTELPFFSPDSGNSLIGYQQQQPEDGKNFVEQTGQRSQSGLSGDRGRPQRGGGYCSRNPGNWLKMIRNCRTWLSFIEQTPSPALLKNALSAEKSHTD